MLVSVIKIFIPLQMQYLQQSDIIIALATPPGIGAIAVIRLSGNGCIALTNAHFKGKNLNEQEANTVHYGFLKEQNGVVLDEVMVTLFKAPKSYTKEDVVEISCHGSVYIQKTIIELFLKAGARMAMPGEFTFRAYANGRFDLTQAEAVADLIASDTAAARDLALNQLKGNIKNTFLTFRQDLIDFAALLELELDFSEEDVEFANRARLKQFLINLIAEVEPLIESFQSGNAIKEGIPVAIIGPPNAGKSTLLNGLLNEEKAIVTPIAGTTRDTIEDTIYIEGFKFRFIDTAGIRHTNDFVEKIGIDRSKQALKAATIVLFVIGYGEDETEILELSKMVTSKQIIIKIYNKIDLYDNFQKHTEQAMYLSAHNKVHINELKNRLITEIPKHDMGQAIIANSRHLEALLGVNNALQSALKALEQRVSSEWVAHELRQALFYLGEITGTIANDELLTSIFTRFCIGK